MGHYACLRRWQPLVGILKASISLHLISFPLAQQRMPSCRMQWSLCNRGHALYSIICCKKGLFSTCCYSRVGCCSAFSSICVATDLQLTMLQELSALIQNPRMLQPQCHSTPLLQVATGQQQAALATTESRPASAAALSTWHKRPRILQYQQR